MKTAALIFFPNKLIHMDLPGSNSPFLQNKILVPVEKIIRSFREADVKPIVFVLDHDDCNLFFELPDKELVFLQLQTNNGNRIAELVKCGISYLKDKCDRVLINPLNSCPLPQKAIQKLIASNADLASPVIRQKLLYPLLLAKKLFPQLLQYKGNGTLEDLIISCGCGRMLIHVDEFVTGNNVDYQRLLQNYQHHLLHPTARIGLAKDEIFFGPGSKQLLLYIEETGSVRVACRQMGLSYSKGWKIISNIENNMGFAVVIRQRGGETGGKAKLTAKGKKLLQKYCEFENTCKAFMQKTFEDMFIYDDDF